MDGDSEYYREQIIQMINSTKDGGTLEYLCTFIKLFLEKWGNQTPLPLLESIESIILNIIFLSRSSSMEYL